jgi:hypothetical protein
MPVVQFTAFPALSEGESMQVEKGSGSDAGLATYILLFAPIDGLSYFLLNQTVQPLFRVTFHQTIPTGNSLQF